jgi:hypothetical protein
MDSASGGFNSMSGMEAMGDMDAIGVGRLMNVGGGMNMNRGGLGRGGMPHAQALGVANIPFSKVCSQVSSLIVLASTHVPYDSILLQIMSSISRSSAI